MGQSKWLHAKKMEKRKKTDLEESLNVLRERGITGPPATSSK